jgi:O-methyltransferase
MTIIRDLDRSKHLSRELRGSPIDVFDSIYEDVRGLTMVGLPGFYFTLQSVLKVIDEDVPGVIVEAGCWKGGMCFAMLLVQQKVYGCIRKPVHAFDSFQGLPPPRPIDGQAALNWASDKSAPTYYDNCKADLDEFGNNANRLGVDVYAHPGLFKDTLPSWKHDVALLRVDCDWFDATTEVLNRLDPKVSTGGRTIIDDYYAWDGCAHAVHEYLSDCIPDLLIGPEPALRLHSFGNECVWWDH